MSTINVNFSIVSVDSNFGVAHVKYWADGATVERFQSDIGPYTVIIPSNLSSMTAQEYNNYFANIGLSIVQRQKNTLDADSSNSIQTAISNVGQEVAVSIAIDQQPVVIEA